MLSLLPPERTIQKGNEKPSREVFLSEVLEEKRQHQEVFEEERQRKENLLPPMSYESYLNLPRYQKEQLIYSHFDGIREEVKYLINRLHRLGVVRYKIYEMLLFRKIDNVERLVRYFEKRKGNRTPKKELLRKAIILLQTNKISKPEELDFLPPEIYSKLLLYVKYAGRRKSVIKRFLEKQLELL